MNALGFPLARMMQRAQILHLPITHDAIFSLLYYNVYYIMWVYDFMIVSNFLESLPKIRYHITY